MKLRRIRNIFFSLLALILILLASLSALVETETGSRWLVKRVASIVDITLGKTTGNLRTGLDVEFIDYAVGEHHYRAEQVSFRWRPAALLYSAVSIQSLHAQNVLIQIPPAAENNPAAPPFSQWPSLALPVRIRLEKINITNINFVQGDTRLQWKKLSGSVGLGTFHLRYKNLALHHADYTLHLSGTTNLRFPYATESRLQWQWQAQVQNTSDVAPLTYMGVTVLTGDLADLQLESQISLPVVLGANAKLQLVDKKQQLQTTPPMTLLLNWQQQTLPAPWWIPSQAQPLTSGKLTASGTWKQYSAQLEGDIHLPDAPALAITAAVNGDLEKIHVGNLFVRELQAALVPDINNLLSANTSSSAATPLVQDEVITTNGLQLSGDVRWLPQLEWQVSADAKRLNLASLIDNWNSDINLAFTTRGSRTEGVWNAALENLQMSGELRGVNMQAGGDLFFDGKNIRSDALNLIVGANQLRVNGSLGESFNLDWNLSAPLLQQIDESLTGSIVSKGELRGDWKKPRVKMQANAEKFSWKSYGVDLLNLSLAPKIAAPTAAPDIVATEKKSPKKSTPKTGAPVEPVTESQLTSLETMSLSGVVDELLHENYALTLNAKQLRIAQNRFSTIKIDGAGSINQHLLTAVVKSTTYGHLDFNLAGTFNGAEWQGELTQLATKIKRVPRWWLTSSKPIRVSASTVQLGAQCFTTRSNLTAVVENAYLLEREQLIGEWLPNQSPIKSPYGWLDQRQGLPSSGIKKYSLPQLCIDGEWASTTGAKFNLLVDSVPLRQFLALFKVEVYFAGVMDGSLHVASKDFSLMNTQLSSNISTRNAELRYQYSGGTTELYAWRDFSVRATMEKAQLNANASMEWVSYGTLEASTQLDLAQKNIVNGKLLAQFSDLAPLETLLPFANNVKGDFRADLSMGGSFAKPYLLGDVSVRNGTVNLPRLGLDITNLEMQINSTQAGNINVVSQLQSGEGRLSLVGDLNQFGTPEWDIQAFVNGTDFEVINLPQLKATLSPDIKLTATREAVRVSGDAVIPWARANIKRLPESATQVSKDAVIVNERFELDEAAAPIEFFTNLKLSLGDDVRFKGFGLNSQLSGKVSLLKDAQRQFFTSGYVSVVDGSYKAYGQTLTIDRGRLVFQGPYENPGLDIRASRIIKGTEEIKVGLEIGGTLQRPIANVYSIPARSESQAMMMLLTGKPASDVTKADASVLLGAMGGLGMDSDGSITSEITQLFRLDELELNSDDGIDQSQLFIGKYLTPKLLVRYVVGIFDRAFSLGMEYQLTKHLRLEAESGESQSVDIVYKIER
ncbi:MAG: translocation/assembly module TamB domain-containing protein [Cellvibrio sp.]|nr:translocation/assembly module TamB domain-containing protein [Cellvibrio sp.]